MAERDMFRAEAVAAAAPAVCAVVVLGTFLMEARWERVLRGMPALKRPPTALESPVAELLEAAVVVARPVAVARCEADTDWMRRQVPGTATLF
jgi:hypothetical protein